MLTRNVTMKTPEALLSSLSLSEVGAPILMVEPGGTLSGSSAAALELLARAGITATPGQQLPLELKDALVAARPGLATQIRPTQGTGAFDCAVYEYGPETRLVLLRELDEEHRELSRRLHRQRLEVTGRIAASVAHEIRSALSSISFNLDYVSARTTEPNVADGLAGIEASCAGVRRTVDSLLHFARLEPGESLNVSLRETFASVDHIVTPLLRERGAQLSYDIAPGADLVRGNTIAIEQILTNLVLNALELEPPATQVTVCCSPCTMDSKSGGRAAVRIEVKDDGPGVPSEICDQIFGPFFTTKAGGTGLGLSIAQEAAQTLSGRLFLEPSAQGARFVVVLPGAVKPEGTP